MLAAAAARDSRSQGKSWHMWRLRDHIPGIAPKPSQHLSRSFLPHCGPGKPMRICTRRFCWRPSGLTCPSGMVWGAIGWCLPKPSVFTNLPVLLCSTCATACARRRALLHEKLVRQL